MVTGSLQDVGVLGDDPRVELVEQDVLMRAPLSSTVTTQLNGQYLWYLDRLDELYWDNGDASSVADNTYHRCPTGALTTAYVIDMPVWAAHSAINGRVNTTTIVDCSGGTCVLSNGAEACRSQNIIAFTANSHGTAVASLLTGNTTGSSQTEVISVNIFPCVTNPTTSQSIVLAAINWIWGNVDARKNAGVFQPSIVNHSGYLFPWDADAPAYTARARDFVLATNVPYFTSADNFGSDSCQFSPNSNAFTPNSQHWSRGIFVLGGTHQNTGGMDAAWWNPQWNNSGDPTRVQNRGTNLGDCVSAFAPAENVYAAANGDHTVNNPVADANYYRTWAPGTSWSSPLTAGVTLRWMSEQTSIPNYLAVYNWLLGTQVSPPEPKASVSSTGHDAYTICYVAGNPTQWEYSPTGACQSGWTAYVMSSPGNTSGAKMISWTRGCP